MHRQRAEAQNAGSFKRVIGGTPGVRCLLMRHALRLRSGQALKACPDTNLARELHPPAHILLDIA